ncbi:DNA polymerase III delta prime subunit [Candidatus Mycoplasma haematolamae str. Purdue]|uniref:DNA 5'-3' helicase n=1 Tax=Mycoplasma haematolamae (strain Purdue) TaxID=1212765 RepID=I7B8Q1_MYCHA|nr:DnaB-like helicase C-terminal domain-containing protein [Candidatus Mycoplasma haematolamae]AFO51600.1 DNA polymerase III delta prime subunit [Candidatus Mycoplasma haematolamae str. Purdue]
MKEEELEGSSLTNLEVLRAEKAVLASYIFNYLEVINLSEIESIPPSLFQNNISKTIFETLLKLEVTDGKYDPILIYDSLKKDTNLSKSFLDNCSKYLENLPRGAHYYNFRKYLDILRNNWMKNELNKLSREILQTNWNLDNMNDLVDKWDKNFAAIIKVDRNLNFLKANEVVDKYNKLVENSQKEDETSYLRTGYSALDIKLKGFKPGQLWVIASRPGIGKTTFALNLIGNNLHKVTPPFSQQDRPPAIGLFSLEMINEIIIEKLIAIESKTSLSFLQRILEGKTMQAQDLSLVEASKKRISQSNLLFCDDANITLGKIIATVKLWSRKYELKLVVIDYLQLINLPLEKELNNLSINQKISLISRQLKILSIELKICILALSQLNRKLEERKGADKVPVLSDLRDSGSIEQDADIVMFLYPAVGPSADAANEEFVENALEEKDQLESDILLKIGKNRYGHPGTVRFKHKREEGRFTLAPSK